MEEIDYLHSRGRAPELIRGMETLADKARRRNLESLSENEIRALKRRHMPYSEAVKLVCGEMQCSVSSFYRYYKDLLHPFSLGGGGRKARFCWEDDILKAIAKVKGAAR